MPEMEIKLPPCVESIGLDNIANIDTVKDQYGKIYKFINRSVEPVKIFCHKGFVLKVYHMLRETETLPVNLIKMLDDYLKGQIDDDVIVSDQNIGFAILSQGFLSVNVWKKGNVLHSFTFTIEKNGDKLSREPLEKTGVACTWEAKIMHFEYELWHQYLKTAMTKYDKKEYIQKFLKGDLM